MIETSQDYPDADEQIDTLIEVEGVLGALLDRPQPLVIRTLLSASLRRVQAVTERQTHLHWVH
jgi:hypothetical protein